MDDGAIACRPPQAVASVLEVAAILQALGFGQDREALDRPICCLGMPGVDRLEQPEAGLSVSFPACRHDEARTPAVVTLRTAPAARPPGAWAARTFHSIRPIRPPPGADAPP